MSATEPIRDKKYIKQLTAHYLQKGELRNYALVVMGIHTALRISDLLDLRWNDVYDFTSGRFRTHIYLEEQKTGKTKSIAIHKQALSALDAYGKSLDKRVPESFLFASNRKKHTAISRVQAYRIIRSAADAIGTQERISCHSLRKTFGYHAWKSGVPIAVIMDIYNHSSFEVTRRYLGICQDDKDKVYLGIKLL